MKDFYLVDDDCMNLFESIVQVEESCIVAPMSIMKKIVFWILGEDDASDPGIVTINSDYDDYNENNSPYLLCYVPNIEFDLGPFGFSIEGFDGPVYIYDRLNSSYLADVDKETAIPFHYRSEDYEDDNTIAIKAQEKTEDSFDLEEDEDGLTGFTEHVSDGDGNYSSYSFYSTDKELVDRMASHRSEIIDMISKRKE